MVFGCFLCREESNFSWRLAFISGLLVRPFVVSELGMAIFLIKIDENIPMLIIAGLMVDVGS